LFLFLEHIGLQEQGLQGLRFCGRESLQLGGGLLDESESKITPSM
jgi:hypothetical protein